jgi:hypothetical protein
VGFFRLAQLQVIQEHPEVLVEVAEESQLQEQQGLTLLQVSAETVWQGEEEAEPTTQALLILATQTAETGVLALDSLAELSLRLLQLLESKDRQGLAAAGSRQQARTELQVQAQEHVPEEPEEQVVEAVEEPPGPLPLAELEARERSSCTGRSVSLCLVTF